MKKNYFYFILFIFTTSFSQENISEPDLLEFSIDNSFEYEVIEDVVRYDIWEQFTEDNKITNLKPEIVTEDTTQNSHIIYDNLNNVFSTNKSISYSQQSTILSLKKYDVINDNWLDIGSSSLQELFEFNENDDTIFPFLNDSLIGEIYTNTAGEYFIKTHYSCLCDLSGIPTHILKYSEQTNEWNVIYSGSELYDFPNGVSIDFIGDNFYLLTSNSWPKTIEGKNGEMIEDVFVEVKKSVDTRTITLGFNNLNKTNKSPNIYFTNGKMYCNYGFTITSVLNSKG